MKSKLNIVIASAVFFMIIVSYQNCGTSQQGSLFDAQTYSQLPYEFSTNQLAYLSCSEQSNVANDHGVFFTFRAGAYNDSNGEAVAGLRLTEDFFYETRRQNNFNRMDILFEDRGTSLSRLQFATRRGNNLAGMFVNESSGSGVEEIDFDYVFGDFGSDEMSAALLTAPTGQYMNYWAPAGINKDAYFEGTLVYNGSESLAQQLRQFFSTGGVLAWTFADSNNPESIRSIEFYDEEDEDSEIEQPIVSDRALGTGYRVAFKQPLAANWYTVGSTHANVPKRVLQSVSEFDLNSKATLSSWNCPRELQLRVVFPDDIWVAGNPKDPSNAANFDANPINSGVSGQIGQTNKLCRQIEDTDALNNGNALLLAHLAIVRRSLPISDWYVNLTDRCIIPKRYTLGSCYGIDSGAGTTRSPEYNMTATCNPAINSNLTGVCAHYFSACYKN
jgi:hypothetical protein